VVVVVVVVGLQLGNVCCGCDFGGAVYLFLWLCRFLTFLLVVAVVVRERVSISSM